MQNRDAVSVTRLPARCDLVEYADGRAEIRHRDTARRWHLGLSMATSVLILAGLLGVGAASGDGWAALFLVATPLLLGGLFLRISRLLGTQDVLVLRDGCLEHRRHTSGAPWPEILAAEAVGIAWSPADADSSDAYFLSVTLPVGDRVLIGWTEDLDEFRRLGAWLTERTGVPFDPEPVRRG